MPHKRNEVYIEENDDHISFVIKLVHPKLYKLVFAIFFGLSIFITISLVILANYIPENRGLPLVPLTIGSLISFYFFKLLMWHYRGEEFFLITVDNFTYQINNGIKLSEIKSFEAPNYKLEFEHTNEYNSKPVGRILFYTSDPITNHPLFKGRLT